MANEVQRVADFTVYGVNFVALAPGATAVGNIQIQADSEFQWTKSSYEADIAAAAFVSGTKPVPNVTLQIVDSGTGRQLFNIPIPVASIFGSGELPFINPVERIFKPRSAIQITAANFDAAVTYNLRLAFIGRKIFTL